MVRDVGGLLASMDECNVKGIVNLDGMWGSELDANLNRYDEAHPGRFATFAQLDWRVTGERGFGDRLADSLRESANRGAKGLKIWKDLGLRVRDEDGVLLMLDDTRLNPIWEAAAEAGLPVMLHVGDPIAFFDPVDPRNERLEELLRNPSSSYADPSRFPRYDVLMDSFERLVANNSHVLFIGAHVAGAAEDLSRVDQLLTSYANLYADIAGRISELGRQPRAAGRLLETHRGRILFGTDQFPPQAAVYALYFRFLETADEYFPYSIDEPPIRGRWAIYGIDLSSAALECLYSETAAPMLPSFELS